MKRGRKKERKHLSLNLFRICGTKKSKLSSLGNQKLFLNEFCSNEPSIKMLFKVPKCLSLTTSLTEIIFREPETVLFYEINPKMVPLWYCDKNLLTDWFSREQKYYSFMLLFSRTFFCAWIYSIYNKCIMQIQIIGTLSTE